MTPTEERALVERLHAVSDRLVLAETAIVMLNDQVESLLKSCEALLVQVRKLQKR